MLRVGSKKKGRRSDNNGTTTLAPIIPILAAASAAAVLSAALRVKLIYWGDLSVLSRGIKNSIFDQLLLAATAFLWCIAALIVRRRARALKWVWASYLLFAVLVVVAGCVNFEAVRIIGGPLTFQWIYYADLLRSFTSQSAIESALTPTFFAMLAICVLCFPLLYLGSKFILLRADRAHRLPVVLGISALLFLAFLWKSSDRLHAPDYVKGVITNPLIELATSTWNAGTTDLVHDPQAIAPPTLPPPQFDANLLPLGLQGHGVRNVVLIVMESVGANHVAGFGNARAQTWTPTVAAYAPQELRFHNVYAHAPYSSKSLFSLLAGRLPLFSGQLETRRFAGRPLSTLGTVLSHAGYRTAFFMSGDLAFQSADRFVSSAGFQTIRDMASIPCDRRFEDTMAEWRNMAVVLDSCTAVQLNGWIAENSKSPFFAVFWTGNTHWPYFSAATATAGTFSKDERENRYIGALRETDAAIATIIDQLKRLGRWGDTVLVVLGDHGEAFGEHGYRAHSSSIYEEEVHIPVMLISGRLHSGDDNRLGAISDIPATILQILGQAPPKDWDGRSLFDPHRPPAVFMFSPNGDMRVGYREGKLKFMLQPSTGDASVFDLAKDPGERINLAGPRTAQQIRHRVAGRLQAQEQAWRKLSN